MKKTILFFGLFLFSGLTVSAQSNAAKEINYSKQPAFAPPTYVCYKAPVAITVDGKITPAEWDAIPAISSFSDISGGSRPKPHLQTKVKMAHDDNGVYIAAWLEEPHLWATITQHDGTLFQENVFEFFFNPSNDTHNYLEYEVNALGTVWDLFLSRPYRDNPISCSNWEFAGMQSVVSVDGTVNNPGDTDKSWSVEVFIPWRSLLQVAPRVRRVTEGTQMRVNFMRVQWPLEVKDGAYVKAPKKEGQPTLESHWVWAPMGMPNIHMPEYWGYVQFTETAAGKGNVPFVRNTDEDIKWVLRNLYYRQSQYHKTVGSYATHLAELKPAEVCKAEWLGRLALYNTPSSYEIIYTAADGKTWHIRQDGLVW